MKMLGSKARRQLIAVRQGTYRGEFFVEMDRTEQQATFLALPDKHIRQVPLTELENGFKNKVLEVVETLPKCVYTICKKEYELIIGEQARLNSNR
jgi:hypothetical protein